MKIFEAHDVDGEVLYDLAEKPDNELHMMLESMELSLGLRMKLMKRLRTLKIDEPPSRGTIPATAE